MNMDQIRRIVERLERSTIGDFEIEINGAVLRGHFAARRVAADHATAFSTAVDASAASPVEFTVKAPSMGVFSSKHPLTGGSCANLGDSVTAEEPLGYLTLGAVVRPVAAPRAAVLRRCLAAQGQIVGYGQPLFELTACQERRVVAITSGAPIQALSSRVVILPISEIP